MPGHPVAAAAHAGQVRQVVRGLRGLPHQQGHPHLQHRPLRPRGRHDPLWGGACGGLGRAGGGGGGLGGGV